MDDDWQWSKVPKADRNHEPAARSDRYPTEQGLWSLLLCGGAGHHGLVDPQRIVVPINPSDAYAQRALPTAVAAARLFTCGIELLHCVEDPHEVSVLHRVIEPIRSSLRLNHPDVVVRASTVVQPHAPEGIIAATQPAHLPVMATRARLLGFQHYLGSAAETVVGKSGRPVLLVGPAAEASRAFDFDAVIVAVSPTEPALANIGIAEHWAQRLDVPMVLVAVVGESDDPATVQQDLETCIAGLRPPDAAPLSLRVVQSSHRSQTIRDLGSTGLIVMNSHARTGLSRLRNGSITTEVVRGAKRAVLVTLIEDQAVPQEPAPQRPSAVQT